MQTPRPYPPLFTRVISLAALMLFCAVRGANADTAKAPLTAAERQQCVAQLAEVNQRVDTHNKKVEEIRALQAEIEALRAELDKEQAGLDRRNGAQMQAFNAKVGKNNEMVARHEQLGAELDASAADNKQRADEFQAACSNRPSAPPAPPPTAQVPLAPLSQAPASDAACNSADGAKEVQRKIEAALAEARADEKKRQADVDRVAEARASAQSWSKEKQGKVWMQILSNPKFAAFEREKQPYVQELMRIITSEGGKAKSGAEQCQLVKRIAQMLPAIKAVNARQYAFMADEIRATK